MAADTHGARAGKDEKGMTISMDKEYTTRDGREVRVLCVDSPVKGHPVIAAIRANGGDWCTGDFTADGLALVGCELSIDLVEVRKTITGFINIYGEPFAGSRVHKTKAEADRLSDSGRIACIPVTFHEGEGL